ncbi:RDD family protein [Streptacidiphilus sp. MAP5-3]|uniref:RDD family protein n=1 Tax=unclassified Streptacidiphilus TaxID=2643834 RepID=UPI003518C63F
MTTPEPPERGEPEQPPSFDKDRPGSGGSPYDAPPPPPPPQSDPYANPYATPGGPGGGQPSYTPPGPGMQQSGMPPLAALTKRLLAQIIDWLVLAIIAVPLSLLATTANNHDRGGLSLTASLVSVFAAFLYEGLMLTKAGGQTLGMKALRIRVAALADGSPPFGRMGWIRAAVWDLPALLCCLWQVVDGAWCTWDQPYRQCLHDKAAKTVVVDAF